MEEKSIKIYSDKELTQEIKKEVDFGIVNIGESQQYTLFILNDSDDILIDLKFSFNDEEIKILEFPKQLNAHEVKELKFKWTPSFTIKKGFKPELQILSGVLRKYGV